MATLKTTKINTTVLKTTDTLRKGLRAYVGMYGAAYERALPVLQKAVKNYDSYAVKGAAIEVSATNYAKDAREFATKRFETRAAQVRSFLPGAANDRVEALNAEITGLNKKIAKLSKKTVKAVKAA